MNNEQLIMNNLRKTPQIFTGITLGKTRKTSIISGPMIISSLKPDCAGCQSWVNCLIIILTSGYLFLYALGLALGVS
jgi:hypothetical protein